MLISSSLRSCSSNVAFIARFFFRRLHMKNPMRLRLRVTTTATTPPIIAVRFVFGEPLLLSWVLPEGKWTEVRVPTAFEGGPPWAIVHGTKRVF